MRRWIETRRQRQDRRVLAAIREGSHTGFTIAQRARMSAGRVYVSLARLEAQGTVRSRWEPEATPQAAPRRRYYEDLR